MDADDADDVIEEIAPRTIRFPAVEYNAEMVTSITLRPLTVADLIAAQKQKGHLAQALEMIQRSAGISPQLAHKLSPKVVEHATEYFARFLPSAPPKDGDPLPPE